METLNDSERARRKRELGKPGSTKAEKEAYAFALVTIMTNWGVDPLMLAEARKLAAEVESEPAVVAAPEPTYTRALNSEGLRENNFNAWAEWYDKDSEDGAPVQRYGDTITYRLAAVFLNGLDLQDWGCGLAFFKQFVTNGKYTGVDGTWSKWCDVHADLGEYRSSTPGLHMRHVIEHNVQWQKVLDNALASFTERMVLTLFTPFAAQTHVIQTVAHGVPDTSFKLSDITDRFTGCTWRMESHVTDTQYQIEHIFYIERA